jgi:uncharacterized membrane protein
MTPQEYKAYAKEKIGTQSGLLIGMCVINSIIILACDAIFAPLSLIVTGPLTLGLAIVSLRVLDGEVLALQDMFAGFYNFGNALLLHILNSLFITLWSLLLVVPGIVKAYAYSMSTYILAENPDITATEARQRSIDIMKGNKMMLFKIHLTYIGWFLLSIFTLGIPLFFIMPQIQVATAAFYLDLTAGTSHIEYDNDPYIETNQDNIF